MASKRLPDCSIDIETLGTKYNAAILSIGAAMFDRTTGSTGPTFYHEIDFRSSIKAGEVDGSTLAWWMRQGDAARRLFSEDQSHKLPLATALHALINFLREYGGSEVRVWGNGSSFDITILEHAFDTGCVGLSPPWRYPLVRDMRTIVDAAEVLRGFKKDSLKMSGVAHNALDDAVHQANVISAAWSALSSGAVKSSTPKAQPASKASVLDDL